MSLRADLSRRSLLQGLAAAAAGVPSGSATAVTRGPEAASTPRARAAAQLARLQLNENPWGPSPAAIRAIERGLGDLWRYTEEEAEALVDALAARERVDRSQIVLGDVLRALGTRLALDKGAQAEVLYSEPGYLGLVDAAATVGARGVGVPLAPATHGDDLEALAQRLGPRTAAVFLVAPHNPTGTLAAPEAFDAFVAHAARHAPVIVDEAYLEYTAQFEQRTLARLVRSGEQVAVYRTFAKFFGLAALPLDYLVASTEIASRLRQAGIGGARDQNRLAVLAAAATLEDRAHAARVRDGVARERDRWLELLRRRGAAHSETVASFVFFDARRPHAEAAAAFAAAGVQVAREFPRYPNWVRVTIGLPRDNDRALAVAARLLA